MPPGSAVVLRREMTCTRAEFIRWIPSIARTAACTLRDEGATLSIDSGEVRIQWREMPKRTLGALSLPRLEVTLAFVELDARQRERFLLYFDLATRRGGG